MSAPITVEPGAPAWWSRAAAQINTALAAAAAPRSPAAIPQVATAADLPSAAAYPSSLVFVAAIARVAVSDGARWLRTDTGAPL